MATISGPVGWEPTPVYVTLYHSAAVTKGDVWRVTLNSTYGTGFTVAAAASNIAVRKAGTIYGVAMEDSGAASESKFCLRGFVPALVEKDTTDIAINTMLIHGTAFVTDDSALTHAEDVDSDVSSDTGEAPEYKILAFATEAMTSTTAALIDVHFDGINGFGTTSSDIFGF